MHMNAFAVGILANMHEYTSAKKMGMKARDNDGEKYSLDWDDLGLDMEEENVPGAQDDQ